MQTWASQKFFTAVHGNHLVYNTCWEDPRLDRRALNLGSEDEVLMITSAGCNALDYLLDDPKRIRCVDMNPRQNALLELKIAGVKSLDFESFFQIFGRGAHLDFREIYRKRLRFLLSPATREFWDEKCHYFEGSFLRPNFYSRGTSGLFGQLFNVYLNMTMTKEYVMAMFDCETVDEQKDIYLRFVRPRIWKPSLEKVLSWDASLALLGVPRAQRLKVEKDYYGGIFQFAKDSVETVFTELPLRDNYFWWLYINGKYTKNRCPEYLVKENFEILKSRVDRIEIETGSILNSLKNSDSNFSRFVLLDHMDWMSTHAIETLREQWSWIFKRAAKSSRILWRSGAPDQSFIFDLDVKMHGDQVARVGDNLTLQSELASELHKMDRVHTYASFVVADVRVH